MFFTEINARGLNLEHEIFTGYPEPEIGVGLNCDTDSCRWLDFEKNRWSLPHDSIKAIRFYSQVDELLRPTRIYGTWGAVIGGTIGGIGGVVDPIDRSEGVPENAIIGVALGALAGAGYLVAYSIIRWPFSGDSPQDFGYTNYIMRDDPSLELMLQFRYRNLWENDGQ